MSIQEELYPQIIKAIPIPCVELVIQNTSGEVLLIKRKNKPAKSEWWFPGGRVHFRETRAEAVKRKLWEECKLFAVKTEELGTFDLILKGNIPTHAVTKVFQIIVNNINVKLDSQSKSLEWLTLEQGFKIIIIILLHKHYSI